MDPIAHTLVGATLGETGLKKTTPLATTTLVLGANAPDLDFFFGLSDPDDSLHVRRGLTHGALAMVVLPVLLAGLMYGLGRWWSARRGAPPPRFGALLALSFISILTHPALDWLNTYGVRLLMPFDGRWFYGDALFIIDPFIWLLTASAIVLATSRSKLGAGAWIALGAGTSALVLGVSEVPWWTQLTWCVGVGAIVLARRGRWAAPETVARTAVVVAAAYIGAMLVGSGLAAREARAWVEARTGEPALSAVTSPRPGDPFSREVILTTEGSYHFVRVAWLSRDRIVSSRASLPRPDLDDPTIRAALGDPSVKGFRSWARLPYASVHETPAGHRVTLHDLRYSRPGEASRAGGFAMAVVEVVEVGPE